MFISKKAFDNLNEFLRQARHNNAEMSKLIQEIKAEVAKKDAIIAALKQTKMFYTTKWIAVRCPKCEHEFSMHTMKED